MFITDPVISFGSGCKRPSDLKKKVSLVCSVRNLPWWCADAAGSTLLATAPPPPLLPWASTPMSRPRPRPDPAHTASTVWRALPLIGRIPIVKVQTVLRIGIVLMPIRIRLSILMPIRISLRIRIPTSYLPYFFVKDPRKFKNLIKDKPFFLKSFKF
jgi:hypothetical protein